MRANELRIGNWVQYDGIPYQIESLTKVDAVVHSIDIFDFRNRSLENAQPIELTEEVLLKIGFVKKNDCYILTNECILFVYYKDSFKQELLASVKREGKCYYNKNELKNYDIKYLHQLQNAYYLLTNEELEVEL